MTEICGCAHPVDPHVLAATEYAPVAGIEDVPVAGIMLCPNCDCVMTWSVAGRPTPPLPSAADLARIRQDVFGEAA